jgi:4-amino-4-deoxy-L-arabinose transferase-like glycosyltransferase
LTPRGAARLLLLPVAFGLTVVALGAPRFTWGNDGVVVDHPRAQAAAALGAALALATAAYGGRPRSLVVAAGLGAAALLGLGASQLAWRIEVVETGFHERSLGRAVHLAWKDIEAVEPREGHVTLRARGGSTVVIGTSRFAPDERVRLERTIARRVTEGAR